MCGGFWRRVLKTTNAGTRQNVRPYVPRSACLSFAKKSKSNSQNFVSFLMCINNDNNKTRLMCFCLLLALYMYVVVCI